MVQGYAVINKGCHKFYQYDKGNAFQVKAEKFLLPNDHDCHAKGPFSTAYEISHL